MPSDSTHQMQLPLCLATVPEIHPHLPPQPPSTSRPSCSWRITSGRRGRRGSAEAPTSTTASPSSVAVGRCSRAKRPLVLTANSESEINQRRGISPNVSQVPFFPLTNGVRSRRGTFSFRLPHRGPRRRRERHFSARLLFLVGGDICLDGGVQSSRGRAKSPLLRHSLHPPYYLAIFSQRARRSS